MAHSPWPPARHPLNTSPSTYPDTYWQDGHPPPNRLPTDPLGSLNQVAALVSSMGTSDLDRSRLATTLCHVFHQCLDIASTIDCGLVTDIENRYRLEVVQNRSNLLYDLFMRRRSKTDVDTMKSVVSEVAWHVDNFNKIAVHNRLAAEDLTAGHFTAPNSVIALVDDTFNLVTMEHLDDDARAVVNARRALQQRLNDMYNLRVNRGTINRDSPSRMIQRISSFLTSAVGRIQLRDVTKRITSTSMPQITKEAIVLAAAGRVGANVDTGIQMCDVLRLVSRDARAAVTVVAYANTPPELWDYLLPYVAVVDNAIYRGLIGGETWLRTNQGSASVAGKRRRYIAVEEDINWSSNASVVREAFRPTIFSISSDNFHALRCWTSPENPVTQRLYANLLECASTGSSPTGKAASNVWRSAVKEVASAYPAFVEKILLPSLTVRSVSAMAIASTDFDMFCHALYRRVVSLLSCEEGKIYEGSSALEVMREKDGSVLVHQAGSVLASDSGLPELARRIEQYCTQDGLKVIQEFPTDRNSRMSPPELVQEETWASSIAAKWSERTCPIIGGNAGGQSGFAYRLSEPNMAYAIPSRSHDQRHAS